MLEDEREDGNLNVVDFGIKREREDVMNFKKSIQKAFHGA
jgi:hypothetical protein